MSGLTHEEADSPDFVDAELCRQDGEPRHDVLVVVNVMRDVMRIVMRLFQRSLAVSNRRSDAIRPRSRHGRWHEGRMTKRDKLIIINLKNYLWVYLMSPVRQCGPSLSLSLTRCDPSFTFAFPSGHHTIEVQAESHIR